MVNEGARPRRMVRELEQRGIAHPLVLKGMAEIARARFVDEALRGKAYDDDALPIGDGQTISQPWIVARMTELLEPDGTGRVLEIGTGSGYHAAVLSRVFEQVYSVERILALSRKARARTRELGIERGTHTYGLRRIHPAELARKQMPADVIPTRQSDLRSISPWSVVPTVTLSL